MAYRRGVGMYPDETCFDVNRPGWLPYWLDDLTESQCKINELISGNTTGNTTPAAGTGADPATIANAMAACAAQSGIWNSAVNICTPSFLGQYGPYLIAGVAGLFFLMVMTRR